SNAPRPANISWSTTGGTISSTTGITTTFTAPAAPGTFTVTATDSANANQIASANVTVRGKDMTIYEVDGLTQANRPITFGRVFIKGEIAQCPQPVVGGT